MVLCSEPVDLPHSLIVDTATGNEKNDGGLEAILCQTDQKGNNKVIAYASRQLHKHENNYTLFLVEMAAIVWAMQHFDTSKRKNVQGVQWP